MLGSLILYLKGIRIWMFQLSGFWGIGFRDSDLGFRIKVYSLSDLFWIEGVGFRIQDLGLINAYRVQGIVLGFWFKVYRV